MDEKKEPQEVEVKYDTSSNREEKVKIVEPATPEIKKQFEKIWENH